MGSPRQGREYALSTIQTLREPHFSSFKVQPLRYPLMVVGTFLVYWRLNLDLVVFY